jgi:hypothetical protein
MQCRSKDFPVSFVVTDPKGNVYTEDHCLTKAIMAAAPYACGRGLLQARAVVA